MTTSSPQGFNYGQGNAMRSTGFRILARIAIGATSALAIELVDAALDKLGVTDSNIGRGIIKGAVSGGVSAILSRILLSEYRQVSDES